MPRYVIEMDEPTRCERCPCFAENYMGGFCGLVVNEHGIRGRYIEETDAWVWTRPDWCPLERLD
jgi:galactose-1-phosphate uridylyltransferase